jgi:hypothetical protein
MPFSITSSENYKGFISMDFHDSELILKISIFSTNGSIQWTRFSLPSNLGRPEVCTNRGYDVRFEVFTAVTMKNAAFWDIKTPVRTSQKTHYVSTTEPSRLMLCKTMKNAVFWDVTPCGSCNICRFGGTYRLLHQVKIISELRTLATITKWTRLLVTVDVPSWLILFTLMMEAIRSTETSVLPRTTLGHIPEDGIHRGYVFLDLPPTVKMEMVIFSKR